MDTIKKHLATIISIVVTIIVGYYGVIWSQNQFKKAEVERRDRAKEVLVGILEEHIINKKHISPSRLSRLITTECREIGIPEDFSPIEIINNAEFNLLNSQHIDFAKKEEYKILFDSIYSTFQPIILNEFISDSTKLLTSNPTLINSLVENINKCSSKEALKDLEELAGIYSVEIEKYRKQKESDEKVKEFLKNPWGILIIIIVSIAYFYFTLPFIKKILEATRKIRKLNMDLNEGKKKIVDLEKENDSKSEDEKEE